MRQSPSSVGSMKRGRVRRSGSVSKMARGAIFSSENGVTSMAYPRASTVRESRGAGP